MSTSRGSGAGNGVQPIPAGSRKIVQSLKEIVSCTEAEIYATLKECNMDPNEAVNRLLSQDPFCEVKSKREKKKEFKDATESRPRGATHGSNRGVKSGADRYLGRGGSAPYNYSESALLHGKSTYKKENGSTPYASSLSSPAGWSETTRGRGPSGFSDDSPAENKGSSWGTTDGISSGAEPPAAYHSAWVGVPGQVSMADIVKMGRPRGPSASVSQHNSSLHEGHASMNHESEDSLVQRVPVNDEWPSIEKPPTSIVTPILEYTVDSKVHPQVSVVPSESINQDSDSEEDNETEDDDNENPGANDTGSLSISSSKISDDDVKGASLFENEYKNMGSYQRQAHDFEHHKGEEAGASITSITKNMQQLSVEKDDGGLPSDSNTPSVVIPNHLQVQTADCSHLSFGSFGSGMSLAHSSGNMTSLPVKSNLEQPESDADFSSVEHPDSRNSEYYVGDSLRDASDGNFYHRTGASARSYNTSSASQPEELKPENAEVAHGNQYPFHSSNPGYTFDDAQRLNGAYSQTISEMQNLAPFSNVKSYDSYPNSLQNTLLAANVQPSRESELQYHPFPVTQSLSAKYENTISSIGGSTISMSEALKTAGLSSAQPTAETPGTSVATGPPLPQHLAVHPYSQPTLPLGPFANMIGYPFLPQSYTYVPSAFQQTFAGNSAYHQSLASGLPQYKNTVSVSSLPQSAAIASGYGAFGNTATIPGNFPLNPSAAAAQSGATLNYDDVLSSHYKDNSHLLSLQQNENSAMWLHGPNSRTMSAVPASSYYNYQGQNQQPGGFRQAQQPSQNYGTLGYPNFYHSQAGMSTLDQPQNPRDGSLGGSQGQPKQSHIWQNSY